MGASRAGSSRSAPTHTCAAASHCAQPGLARNNPHRFALHSGPVPIRRVLRHRSCSQPRCIVEVRDRSAHCATLRAADTATTRGRHGNNARPTRQRRAADTATTRGRHGDGSGLALGQCGRTIGCEIDARASVRRDEYSWMPPSDCASNTCRGTNPRHH